MKTFLIILTMIVLLSGGAYLYDTYVLDSETCRFICPNGRTPGTGNNADSSADAEGCPDEKIINRMPGPEPRETSYYIKDGERRELDDYDPIWIQANCNVPEQIVY